MEGDVINVKGMFTLIILDCARGVEKMRKCSMCLKNEFDDNKLSDYSLSRKDNKTKICNPCGMEEAFKDMPKE